MPRKLVTNNAETVLRLLFEQMNIPYKNKWHKRHLEHPDFPSFMSYHHLLKSLGIDSAAIHVSLEDLVAYPMPMIVYVKTNGGMFLLINKIEDKNVYFINEHGSPEKLSIAYFYKIWSSDALIIDVENVTLLKEPASERIKECFSVSKYYLLGISLLVLIGRGFFLQMEIRNIYNILFIFCYIIGIVISILFYFQEFDRNNSLVKKICYSKTGNKKMNCSSILNTKAAYFCNLFSWSDLGLLYFVSLFFIMIFLPINLANLVGTVMGFLAFPYVFYSICYQKFVAKKWCRLCLGVQVIFFFLFIISLFSWKTVPFLILFSNETVNVIFIPILIISLLGIFKPMLRSATDIRRLRSRFVALKNNHEVVSLMFRDQVSIDTTELEKIILTPLGQNCITVIFNTTCNPCIKEVQELLDLYQRKTDTRIELIFLLPEDNDSSALIAKYLLQKYAESPSDFVKILYAYISEYPMCINKMKRLILRKEEENHFDTIIKDHTTWCLKNGFITTPTLFYNNQLVPEVYLLSDLNYLCD